MFRLLVLGFVLFVNLQCIQTQDEFDTDSVNEEDQSISLRGMNSITVGNDVCKDDTTCGFHKNTGYSWCYTIRSWDYCCVGPCEPDADGKTMSCDVGDQRKTCGFAGGFTISGKECLTTHQCGQHGKNGDFWCYYNYKFRWEKCCSPLSKCSNATGGTPRCAVNYEDAGSDRMEECLMKI
ncbi:hypothetical protein ACJMK2_001722 [Sinanodonta woodiana]|uniref:Uncharacterized protein n=1 Tax=Sinanodonta woodiana TaxID=1069815 RepID=A0ABD3XWG5_SINWO